MGKGKTLFEMGKEWWKGEEPTAPAQELAVFNPLRVKVGDFVQISTADLAGKDFIVTELDLYTRRIGGQKFEFVDYILHNETDDKWVTLRLVPKSDAPTDDPGRYQALVLYPDYESEYDEVLHKQVLPSGQLEVRDASGNIVATYARLDGLTDPYHAEVSAIKGGDTPIEHSQLDYWDFGRQVSEHSLEFYFVEMNADTGWFQMSRGVKVFAEDILPLRKQ